MDISGPPLPTDTGQPKRVHTKRKQNKPAAEGQPSGSRKGGVDNPNASTGQEKGPHRPNRKPRPAVDASKNASNTSSDIDGTHASKHPAPSKPDTKVPSKPRRTRFGAELTNPTSSHPSQSHKKGKYRLPEPTADDLTSTLIRGLSVPPYADCPICFSAIHPAQPTWSCSPLIPVIDDDPQYCWTTFHLKCIRPWAEKSFKEVKEAWRARGEDRDGEWRCPGCQGKRHILMGGYRCFCGSTPQPNARLATPHSCGNSCSRTKKACAHPCPLPCHPGPCPPCKIMLEVPCHCPRQKIVPVRCGEDTRVSCGEICERQLNCGKHKCQKPCHLGPCGNCEDIVEQQCWCGNETREIACGLGEKWTGSAGCQREGETVESLGWSCPKPCQRAFDCGVHSCERPCHPLTASSPNCPLSPSNISTCPCGKKVIGQDFPARTSCSDPVPTCQEPCQKSHATCEHNCLAPCHTGDCPPCSEPVMRPCRCGNIRQSIKCGDLYVTDAEAGITIEAPVLCDKACTALRACGRHTCNRVCCPLASLASVKGKGKKRVIEPSELGEDAGGLHECDLVCGRMLSCGNHQCELRDHKGPCPPCLQSSFEELICFCGRTVLEPPVPCGTKIQCSYPCVFPPPECGHPKSPHACHGDDVSCPPCPFLATKLCACGAKMVQNVRCSLDRSKIGCGTVCGKLLGCGFHHCERVCHADECGPCTTPCGKSRKSCLPAHHPCTEPCHAPAACSEKEPCQALVTLTCPCGRIKQTVRCERSTTNGNGRNDVIKCTSECEIAKRNARLADALGINPAQRDRNAGSAPVYSDELLSFARLNDKFVPVVERAFAEFVNSTKKTQVLPHMPMDRRKFVIELAGIYRMDTQMVDQEPHRSVQIIRRIDTRVPSPPLSAQVASKPNLGKLGNLRSSVPVVAVKPTTPPPAPRGWASAVSAAPTPNTQTASSRPATPPTRPAVPQATPYRPPGARAALAAATTATSIDVPDDWEDDA